MAAQEELLSEVLLQQADLPADGNLGQVHLVGRRCETAMAGRSLEGDEEVERRQVFALASHNVR